MDSHNRALLALALEQAQEAQRRNALPPPPRKTVRKVVAMGAWTPTAVRYVSAPVPQRALIPDQSALKAELKARAMAMPPAPRVQPVVHVDDDPLAPFMTTGEPFIVPSHWLTSRR